MSTELEGISPRMLLALIVLVSLRLCSIYLEIVLRPVSFGLLWEVLKLYNELSILIGKLGLLQIFFKEIACFRMPIGPNGSFLSVGSYGDGAINIYLMRVSRVRMMLLPQLNNTCVEWNSATKKENNSLSTSVCFLNWQKPNYGCYKINVDGTRTSDGRIGAGGVIRDGNGIWCHDFMRNIGTWEVLQAEAWGVFSGLQIAKEMGIDSITVESDSAVLINLFQSHELHLHPLGTLVKNCIQFMNSFRDCRVTHIHRERNMVADCLAKRSVEQGLGL